jgi:hypothetical protein
LLDVSPTILAAVEAPAFDPSQGHSLWGVVTGRASSIDASPVFGTSPHLHYARFVRRGRWKLIEASSVTAEQIADRHLQPDAEVRDELISRIDTGPALYDLESDPLERANLWGQHTEVSRELAALIEAQRTASTELKRTLDERGVGARVELSDAEKQRLRALGYAH